MAQPRPMRSEQKSPQVNPVEAILMNRRVQILNTGYTLASSIVPSLLDRTTTKEQAVQITTFVARELARKYETDLKTALNLGKVVQTTLAK